MAATIRTVGTPVFGTSGTITPTVPTYQVGDILLLILGSSANASVTPTHSPPAGWNNLLRSEANSSGTTRARCSIYWKRAVASEGNPGVTVTPTGSTACHHSAVILSIQGADQSSTPFDSNNGGGQTAAASTQAVNLTTQYHDELCILATHHADNIATGVSNNGGYTQDVATDDQTGIDGFLYVAHEAVASAGANNCTVTYTSGGTGVGIAGVSIAIKSAGTKTASADAVITQNSTPVTETTDANSVIASRRTLDQVLDPNILTTNVKGASTSTATSLTSDAFNAPTGSKVYALVGVGRGAAISNLAVAWSGGTPAGASDFVQKTTIALTGSWTNYTQAKIYESTITSGITSKQAIASWTASSEGAEILGIFVVENATAGAVATKNSGDGTSTLDATINTEQARSRLLGVFVRFDNTANPTLRSDTTRDGTAYTDVANDLNVGVVHLTDLTSASGNVTLGFTDSVQYALGAAIEIKGTVAAGGVSANAVITVGSPTLTANASAVIAVPKTFPLPASKTLTHRGSGSATSGTGITINGVNAAAGSILLISAIHQGTSDVHPSGITVNGQAATRKVWNYYSGPNQTAEIWAYTVPAGGLSGVDVVVTYNGTITAAIAEVTEVTGAASVTAPGDLSGSNAGNGKPSSVSRTTGASAGSTIFGCFAIAEYTGAYAPTDANTTELHESAVGTVKLLVAYNNQDEAANTSYTVSETTTASGWWWAGASLEIVKSTAPGGLPVDAVIIARQTKTTDVNAVVSDGQYHPTVDVTANAAIRGSVIKSVDVNAIIDPTPDPGYDPLMEAQMAGIITPVDGETFIHDQIDLRFTGVGRDTSNWQNENAAQQVEFRIDGTTVLTVPYSDSDHRDYWVYFGWLNDYTLEPGDHTIDVVAKMLDNSYRYSRVITIHVVERSYATTVNLTGDVTPAELATLAGGSMVGTSGSRIKVNGAGHRIVLNSGSASFDWQYVDFHNIGGTDRTIDGISITTTGNATIKNCRFDYCNPFYLSLGGTATAVIRDNVWPSNVRQPIGQNPLPSGGSYPAIYMRGSSTGNKVFAGNRMGAGWLDFDTVDHWTVGGSADADGNVFIGARVGVFFGFLGSGANTNCAVKRNYLRHIYFGGWSQASLLELGQDNIFVQHNVIIGSSWPVRGCTGEFCYNLVVITREEGYVWVDTNAWVHHNVFIGWPGSRQGIANQYASNGIKLQNNTFDGISGDGISSAVGSDGNEIIDSNIFTRLTFGTSSWCVEIIGGSPTTDYNLFHDVETPYYEDSRNPTHDVNNSDPLFDNPAPFLIEWDEGPIWEGTAVTRDVLIAYRYRYTPDAGSPALGAGSTATFGSGNCIGAIGATGAAAAYDKYGLPELVQVFANAVIALQAKGDAVIGVHATPKTADANAVVSGLVTKTANGSAVVQGYVTKDALTSAVISGPVTKTANGNAVIKALQALTFQGSAAVANPTTATANGSAAIRGFVSLAVLASAVILAKQTVGANASAVIVGHPIVTADASAVIVAISPKTVTLDAGACIKGPVTNSANGSAVILAHQIKTADGSAVIRGFQSLGAQANAVVLLPGSPQLQFQASACIRGPVTKTANFSAVISIKPTATALADAVILLKPIKFASGDAVIKALQTLTYQGSAVIRGSVTVGCNASAVIIIPSTNTATVFSDAVIRGTVTNSVLADAAIRGLRTRTVLASAIVVMPGDTVTPPTDLDTLVLTARKEQAILSSFSEESLTAVDRNWNMGAKS